MKIKFIFWVIISFSFSTVTLADDAESSIKNLSVKLAAINQEINAVYLNQSTTISSVSTSQTLKIDNHTIQIKIPNENINNLSSVKLSQAQTEGLYDRIINKMYELKKEYENNPYIRINGFDITVGVMIPTVTVNVEFNCLFHSNRSVIPVEIDQLFQFNSINHSGIYSITDSSRSRSKIGA